MVKQVIQLFTTLAIDIIDGNALSSKMHYKLLPKKTNVLAVDRVGGNMLHNIVTFVVMNNIPCYMPL